MAEVRYDERNARAMQTIRSRIEEMQNYTDRICNQLNMSAAARTAAERAYKKVSCGKTWGLLPRASDEQRIFMRMMLRLALATDPDLIGKADEVAKYLCSNYGYEWLNSDITATAREEAKAMVLSAGESSFGDAGTAGALAYVRCHHKTLKHHDVGDFGKTYAVAARLAGGGELNNRHDATRKALGMDKLRNRRDVLLERAAAANGNG
jgi:hypothetical protein